MKLASCLPFFLVIAAASAANRDWSSLRGGETRLDGSRGLSGLVDDDDLADEFQENLLIEIDVDADDDGYETDDPEDYQISGEGDLMYDEEDIDDKGAYGDGEYADYDDDDKYADTEDVDEDVEDYPVEYEDDDDDYDVEETSEVILDEE